MIRFRFVDDERRFIRLHSEMYEKLARSGLSEVVGSETLRNVGKIEQMAFMEGVRQGLAVAALAQQMEAIEESPIHEPHALKAFQLHSMVYGSSDTPLRAVEKEWLGRLGVDEKLHEKSWLDDKPMRFAPQTLQELDGTSPPVAPVVSIRAQHKPAPVTHSHEERRQQPLPAPESMHGAEVTVPELWQKGEYDPYDPLTDKPVFSRSSSNDDEVMPESPEFLDVVRDTIQTMKRGGWDPKGWQDLVLGLHRHMGVDAGFIDLQLTTHVGRTVLDQCGLIGMAPPDMISADFFAELPGRSPAPSEPDLPNCKGCLGSGCTECKGTGYGETVDDGTLGVGVPTDY